MVDPTKEDGQKVKCRVSVNFFGLMALIIEVNIKMIFAMEKEK
jgi:hypothetical protein